MEDSHKLTFWSFGKEPRSVKWYESQNWIKKNLKHLHNKEVVISNGQKLLLFTDGNTYKNYIKLFYIIWLSFFFLQACVLYWHCPANWKYLLCHFLHLFRVLDSLTKTAFYGKRIPFKKMFSSNMFCIVHIFHQQKAITL